MLPAATKPYSFIQQQAPVERNLFDTPASQKYSGLWLIPGLLAAVYLGWLVSTAGIPLAGLLLGLPFGVAFVWGVFRYPKAGLIAALCYGFGMPYINRHFPGPQYGLALDGLLVLSWLGVLFYQGNRFRWRHLHNDLVWLMVAWMGLTVLEIANPSRPNLQGWLQEMRGSALYWFLTVPLVFFVFNRKRDINVFLHLIIAWSLLGALYGAKQLHLGVDGAERAWLEAGAKRTHILFGKLRVFSFYAESAQFGASQGALAVSCLILAAGPYKGLKKLGYALAGAVIFYGMLISGTRGAMGALLGGGLVFLVLSKQLRSLLVGLVVFGAFLGMLKFTTIGNNNDQIRRLRSSVNPNDPSLLVRLNNQAILRESLKTKPFGTGVGTIGMWGVTFNKHIYTSAIPPDSLYVKNWVMYGVVGFTIWLGIMLYIIGKAAGLVWRTRDPALRNQMMALCAGAFGLLVCSYGNEVMNQMPSVLVVAVSWALLWLCQRWDTPAPGPAPQQAVLEAPF
ncbi:O-antigen ligase family protein [Paraflavisolibacter sp. H34]|uniref:O-antigen ligase family protein n=1 Tax=Huijunlia imazamoxiresistens TaxID=3127457 RepID=UPI0030162013